MLFNKKNSFSFSMAEKKYGHNLKFKCGRNFSENNVIHKTKCSCNANLLQSTHENGQVEKYSLFDYHSLSSPFEINIYFSQMKLNFNLSGFNGFPFHNWQNSFQSSILETSVINLNLNKQAQFWDIVLAYTLKVGNIPTTTPK